MKVKIKTKLQGGMSKNWLQTVRKSPGVSRAVKKSYDSLKQGAEAKASARWRTGFKYHYGSKKFSGSWGDTWLIWGMSPMARKNTQFLKHSARDVGLKEGSRGQ